MASHFLVLGLFVTLALASEQSPLQDFCVADYNSSVLVNGWTCKDPKLVQAEDFHFSGLHLAANTSNAFGHQSTSVRVTEMPGLNTLGVSIARNDFAPWGVNPPRIHHQASETIFVLEGVLEVGFVTSSPENRLVTKVIQKGDVFVFPKGLVHFNHNLCNCSAVSFGAFNSENPGAITVPDVIFGSKPELSSNLLAMTFRVDENIVLDLQSKF